MPFPALEPVLAVLVVGVELGVRTDAGIGRFGAAVRAGAPRAMVTSMPAEHDGGGDQQGHYLVECDDGAR